MFNPNLTHNVQSQFEFIVFNPCSMFNPSFIFNVKALNFMLRLGFYTLKSVKVLCYWFSSSDLIDLVLLIMLKFIIVIISLFTGNKINL